MRKLSNQHQFIGTSQLSMTLLLLWLMSFPSFAYQLVDLGPDVAPKDINNYGVVVGGRNSSQYPPMAFRYDVASGQFRDLEGTVAYGINDAGVIAGNTLTGAFVLDGNNLRTWDEQGAYGISETGTVSGNKAGKNPYRTTSLPYNPAVYEAGKWIVMDIAKVYPRGTRDGVYADIFLLDDVNDNGIAVGSKRRYGLAGSSAIMITPPYNTINDLSDVSYLSTPAGGVASAINNSNMVVGTTGNNSRTGDYATAFVYDSTTSTLTLLGTLSGGQRSSGLDINESNTVVGSSETDSISHAFIWDERNGMVDLNSLAGETGWVLMSAVAMNEQGDIVGTGQLNGQDHGFLLVKSSTPPPPTVNEAPIAVASADITSGKAPLSVQFTSTGSSDPDGDVITYSWDFGDGGGGSADSNPTHTYYDPGNYLVNLTVTDEGGLTSTASLDIKVRRSNGKK